MNIISRRKLVLGGFAAAVTTLAGSFQAVAAPLNLPRAPLFLNAAVEPNILTTLDDSGSMTDASMPDSVDTNCGYRFPGFYSHVFNRIYYNPAITYTPPLQPDGSQFPNATFSAAWLDGYEGQSTTIVPGAAGAATRNLGTRYYPSLTMPARSASGTGTRIPHGFWAGAPSTNCLNPNGQNVDLGNNFALPADGTFSTAAELTAGEVHVLGTGVFTSAAGVGITNDQINNGETLRLDFIVAGGLPGGAQLVQIRFNDVNDTAGGDRVIFNVYGVDRTTLIATTTVADVETTTLSFGQRNVGRLDIVGSTNSNVNFRSIVRYREEMSAFLPFTSNSYVGFDSGFGTFQSAAFYYEYTGPAAQTAADLANAANYIARSIPAAQEQNFANWYSYYRTRFLMARSALSRVFGVQDEGLRIGWQNLDQTNDDGAYAAGTPIASRGPGIRWRAGEDYFARFTGTGRDNFFHWLYRAPASGATPNRAAMIRAGNAFRVGATGTPPTDLRNPYFEPAPLSRELTCRQNFHIHLTDGFTNENANPAIPAAITARPDTGLTLPAPAEPVGAMGQPYVVDSPETMIYNTPNDAVPNSCGAGNACVPSLADIAFAYWATDLRAGAAPSGLTNNVPAYYQDRTGTATQQFWNPVNDPAQWQHMVNFTVGLGVAGTLNFPGDYNALLAGTIRWPGLVNLQPPAIDDLWRAGVVSRGGYFSANNPQELVDSLSATLSSVVVRRGTASAATVTSGIIQSSTLAFRTGFDSGDWSGEVNAFNVDSNGLLIQPPVWAADVVLDTFVGPVGANSGNRKILTSSDPAGGGIPFRWGSLPAAYQASLNDNPATALVDNDGAGALRVDYIRGDRAREPVNIVAGDTGPRFRSRTSVLGAVVNSGAVIVAAPSGSFNDIWPAGAPEGAAAAQKYSEFRATYKTRRRVIYVGGNSGMMHAFDAGRAVDSSGNAVVDPGTGDEIFAYVPREVASTLSRMTNPNFEYTPYVDNTPVVRDVFYGNAWHTVLLGSLRRGGQGIFALDITSPATIDESTAATTVLWEFSDDHPSIDARRLGYTFGRPNIARLANGKWVAVVPGGYNNDEVDAVTGNGSASLFILDIQTGALIKEFNIPTARGLATPTMGDYDNDFIDDLAVAGDLDGNIWRFAFTTPSLTPEPNPANWIVEKMWNPATAGAQPVTAAPRLFPDPGTGGLIAVFGTGKYLEPSDRGIAGVPTQTMYGVREYGRGSARYPITRAGLVQQTLSPGTALPDGTATFNITSNGLSSDNPDFLLATSGDGWFFDFPGAGERDVTTAGAQFSAGLAIISTIIPNGDDPCLPGLRGNVFLVQGATGSTARAFATDANNDGVLDTGLSQVGVAVTSSVSEGSPAVLAAAGGGVGRLVDFPSITVPQTVWRRRSWREIQPDDL